jgi:hypothetical protein
MADITVSLITPIMSIVNQPIISVLNPIDTTTGGSVVIDQKIGSVTVDQEVLNLESEG